jgi:LPS sulfotransferase NodH
MIARPRARQLTLDAITRRISRRLLSPPRPRIARPAPGTQLLDADDRLVPSPVFVYSAQRSGSTLLRMILDGHSQICAPHEMHLRSLRADFSDPLGRAAWRRLGVPEVLLADVLWDRLLHLVLTRSGKSVIVDKVPANVLMWRRIARSWPEARYIFLKRHPVRIAESLAAARPERNMREHYARVNQYGKAWVAARAALPGLTISYEALTADPERVIRAICDYLGMPFEPAMLDYADAAEPAGFRRGLGDWNEKIKSGVIQRTDGPPKPAEIPRQLRKTCRALGYL